MRTERPRKKEMTAPDYIRATFDPHDRLAVVVQNERRGEILERITTALRVAGPPFQDWLRYKNERDGCDIYLGMNPLKPEAQRRTKDDIQVFKHVFINFDQTGGRSLQALERSPLVPPPSYVLNTSPDRFQIIWRVEGVTAEHGEALLHSLARHFDADPTRNDSLTVLRLPGYANKKYKEDFLVAVHAYTERSYHPRDFRLRIEPADSGPVRQNSAPRSDPREPSQSERDGAYAKHALARGFPPEEVICDIAEFRAQDTPHAEDYARRTVIKAQAELSPHAGRAHGSARKLT
jgi:RepB DNA-primase N-terminal domain